MWIVRSFILAVLLIGTAWLGVPPALATELPAKEPSPQERLEELDQKVRILDRRWEVAQEDGHELPLAPARAPQL